MNWKVILIPDLNDNFNLRSFLLNVARFELLSEHFCPLRHYVYLAIPTESCVLSYFVWNCSPCHSVKIKMAVLTSLLQVGPLLQGILPALLLIEFGCNLSTAQHTLWFRMVLLDFGTCWVCMIHFGLIHHSADLNSECHFFLGFLACLSM